jgi:hypothetical protein
LYFAAAAAAAAASTSTFHHRRRRHGVRPIPSTKCAITDGHSITSSTEQQQAHNLCLFFQLCK